MREQPNNLQDFLEHCSYPELLAEIGADLEQDAPLVDYIRSCTPTNINALLAATYRLCDQDLDEEELLLLGRVRELGYAHLSLLDLVSDDDSFVVDPRRLYAHSDDDLFVMAHYAELISELRGGFGPYFPGLPVAREQITATVTSVLAATVARGYDPLPTSDPLVARSLGNHIMRTALAAGDATEIVAFIHNLPQYAARCAAPRFAHGYLPGYHGYDELNVPAILTAVLAAADDGSDDEAQGQLEGEDDA